MKKLIRVAAVSMAIACCSCAAAISVGAASTPENAKVSTAENANAHSDIGEAIKKGTWGKPSVVANTSGSYHAPTKAAAAEKLNSVSAFTAPTVYVDPVTHAISNVYDADGNLIPATLSSDGHWYIVPTNEGYLFLPTGR